MSAAVRVALAQIASSTDQAATRAQIEHAVRDGARGGAALVVLPEYATVFDPAGVDPSVAQPLDGPAVTFLRELAARHAVAIVAGTTTVSADGDPRASNTLVAVAADGALAGVYRKVHLYDAFGHRESDRLEPGPADAAPVVVAVGGLRFGLQTCYDLRFPESSRWLVDAGAEVLVVPAAWAAGPGKVEQWRVLARARAIENTCAVLAVSQAGRGVVGHSLAVGPTGTVLAELGAEPAQALVEVDPAEIARVRAVNPSLVNRRYAVVPR
ncbi:MAG: carbon-nitrogen hydrolase family protein [Cellulomonadaceae bacterium]